jgi:hypothetical protein
MPNPQILFENLQVLSASRVMEEAVTSAPNGQHFDPHNYIKTASLFETPSGSTAPGQTNTLDIPSA